MLTPEQIRIKLQDRKLAVVAEHTRMSSQALWYIRTGKSKNLRYETVVKLSAYFEDGS